MDAYEKNKMTEARRRHLLVRRERLRQLLQRESDQYVEEMRRLARGGGADAEGRAAVVELRLAREEMRKEREAEQKREAEEKMLQHWKINNPEFREVGGKKNPQLLT